MIKKNLYIFFGCSGSCFFTQKLCGRVIDVILQGLHFEELESVRNLKKRFTKQGLHHGQLKKGLWKVKNVPFGFLVLCSNLVHDLFLLIPSNFCEYELLLTAACWFPVTFVLHSNHQQKQNIVKSTISQEFSEVGWDTKNSSLLVIGHKVGPGPPSFPKIQSIGLGRRLAAHPWAECLVAEATLEHPTDGVGGDHGDAMNISGGVGVPWGIHSGKIGMWWDSYGKLWDFMGFVEISGSFIENNVE